MKYKCLFNNSLSKIILQYQFAFQRIMFWRRNNKRLYIYVFELSHNLKTLDNRRLTMALTLK